MTIDVQLDGNDESNSDLLQQQGEQCRYCGKCFLRQKARDSHEQQCDSNPDSDTSAMAVESERMPDEPPFYVVLPARSSRVYHTNPECHKIRGTAELDERSAEQTQWHGLRPCSNCIGDGGDAS